MPRASPPDDRIPEPLSGPEQRERFLSTVLDTIASLVLVLDREGRIVFFNRACEVTSGYSFDEVKGRHPWDMLLRAEDVPAVRSVFGKLRAGQSNSYDNVWVAKDGGIREIAWTNTILGDAEGNAQWVVPTGIDVTARRAAERRVLENERQIEEERAQSSKLEAIGRLAGGVAHDFNNLLVVILGAAGALRDELPETSPLREDADQILQAGRKAASLTQQLLAFGRKRVVRREPLDVCAVIAEMRPMLQRMVGEDVKLVAAAPGGPCRVVADAPGVQQILLNLVANARDAMPGGGTLTIATEEVEVPAGAAPDGRVSPGRWILLTVRDTGVGMEEEVRRRIFEPFFTTKAEGHGTGLGLATVFGIVKQLGGHVSVESSPGAGACFRIHLPRADAAAAAAIRPLAPAPSGAGRAVLVVEDDPAVLGIAVRCLEDGGYRVLSAGDPREALAVASRHDGPIDALLTDVIMPRLNGRELAGRLRAARPSMGVVYMSGYTNDIITRTGELDPGLHLIEKPFARDDLLRAMAAAIAAAAPEAERSPAKPRVS